MRIPSFACAAVFHLARGEVVLDRVLRRALGDRCVHQAQRLDVERIV